MFIQPFLLAFYFSEGWHSSLRVCATYIVDCTSPPSKASLKSSLLVLMSRIYIAHNCSYFLQCLSNHFENLPATFHQLPLNKMVQDLPKQKLSQSSRKLTKLAIIKGMRILASSIFNLQYIKKGSCMFFFQLQSLCSTWGHNIKWLHDCTGQK